MQAVYNGFERVADARLRGATYKYAPAGKMESAPGRSGPSVGLPVIDRRHLTMFNGLRVTVISHPATFDALPVVVISHPAIFKGLPVTEIGHPVMSRALPVTVDGYRGINFLQICCGEQKASLSIRAARPGGCTTCRDMEVRRPAGRLSIPLFEGSCYFLFCQLKHREPE